MQKIKFKIYNLIYPLITVAAILLLWQITAWIVNENLLIPSLDVTFRGLGKLLSSGATYSAVGWTLLRALESFSISFVVAMGLALLAGSYKIVERLLKPLVILMKAVPTMSVILIAMIWLTGMQVPILSSFILIFPLLYGNFLANIQSVDKRLLEMATVYQVPKKKIISHIYLPKFLPRFFDDCAGAISFNLKLIIAAEVLAQTRNSIGVNMQISQAYLNTDLLLAWTIIAIILGGLLELIVFGFKKLYLIDIAKVIKKCRNKQDSMIIQESANQHFEQIDKENQKTKSTKLKVSEQNIESTATFDIQDLSVSYNENCIYDNFNLQLERGKTLCIMGSSGSGKTTLLKAIANLVESSGEINLPKKVGYVFQDSLLIDQISCQKNCLMVMNGGDNLENKIKVNEIFKGLEIEDCLDKTPDNISGGQAGRVSIARALCYDCQVLLLDEPFRGLDIKTKFSVLKLFDEIVKQTAKTVIFVSHDIDDCLNFGDRIVVLKRKDNQGVLIVGDYNIDEHVDNQSVRQKVYDLLVKN